MSTKFIAGLALAVTVGWIAPALAQVDSSRNIPDPALEGGLKQPTSGIVFEGLGAPAIVDTEAPAPVTEPQPAPVHRHHYKPRT